MAKRPENHNKAVTPTLINQIATLASNNTPTRIIGLKTGRSTNSIYKIASTNKISLKPTNQSPYNRKKK